MTGDSDPEFWRLTDILEDSVPIIGTVLGDIMWYFDHWKCEHNNALGYQGSVGDLLFVVTIADALAATEGTIEQ